MAKLQINGQVANNNPDQGMAFFRLAFRPFFWLGAVFSIVSIGLWALTLHGHISFVPFGGGYFWHLHEMLFGFVVAIICGFLLTAVQTWTGVASVKGPALMLLVGIWLLARILFMMPQWINGWLITVVDLSFLPLAAMFLARPIIKAQLWRNLFFVPILMLMWIINFLMHLTVHQTITLTYVQLSHLMILLVTLVMCIMGGRVFPMFTANGTQTPKVLPITALERLSIVSVILVILMNLNLVELPTELKAFIYLLAGFSNLVRALRWKIWVTLTTPLVWSLHISYWALSIGLMLLGLVELQLMATASLAYHAITVGGMGIMILSMISRVSLGHTGRKIVVGPVMTLALLFALLAVISRVLAPAIFGYAMGYILFSALCWIVAYGAFVVVYAPIVFTPRVDGRPG